MSDVLNFDMATKLRKAFADFREQALRDTRQAQRDARERELRESYAKRREPDTSGPEAA